MARQLVLIKASFFLDTDVFQHLYQWESSLIDFYAAHGLEVERLKVMGAGDGNLFYTVKEMGVFDKPIAKQEPAKDMAQLLERRKLEEKKPSSSNQKISIGGIKEQEREKLTYSKGHVLPKTISNVPIIKYRPFKKRI